MIDYTEIDHGPLKRQRKLSRTEFVEECAVMSRTTPEHVEEYHTIAECNCGADHCPGWKATYLLSNRRKAARA